MKNTLRKLSYGFPHLVIYVSETNDFLNFIPMTFGIRFRIFWMALEITYRSNLFSKNGLMYWIKLGTIPIILPRSIILSYCTYWDPMPQKTFTLWKEK